MKPIRIVFFDAKDYDIQSFENMYPVFRERHPEMPVCEMKFFDTRLSGDTVNLAKGADVICIFVNDIVDRTMAETLADMGVKLIALRCADTTMWTWRPASERFMWSGCRLIRPTRWRSTRRRCS